MKVLPKYKYLLIQFCLILSTIFLLHIEGHTFLSETGKIYLWMGDLSGNEVSQQLSDWYSFSHFIHGILFFWLLTYLLRFFSNNIKKSELGKTITNKSFIYESHFDLRLTLALLMESFWEVLENSPIIINRYREGALAAGYFGDSILNSLSDLFFMTLGFFFAYKTYSRFSWKLTLAIVLFFELLTLYFIRDNLTLNIIMLLHPFDEISSWQVGM